eukprot:2819290-Pleurochrysis_carterae.AAC.1
MRRERETESHLESSELLMNAGDVGKAESSRKSSAAKAGGVGHEARHVRRLAWRRKGESWGVHIFGKMWTLTKNRGQK